MAPEANPRGVSEIYILWCWMDMKRNESFGAAYGLGEAKGQGTAPTPAREG
jgi:hypothetical protein